MAGFLVDAFWSTFRLRKLSVSLNHFVSLRVDYTRSIGEIRKHFNSDQTRSTGGLEKFIFLLHFEMKKTFETREKMILSSIAVQLKLLMMIAWIFIFSARWVEKRFPLSENCSFLPFLLLAPKKQTRLWCLCASREIHDHKRRGRSASCWSPRWVREENSENRSEKRWLGKFSRETILGEVARNLCQLFTNYSRKLGSLSKHSKKSFSVRCWSTQGSSQPWSCLDCAKSNVRRNLSTLTQIISHMKKS